MSILASRCEPLPSLAKRMLALMLALLMVAGAPGAAYADTLPWLKDRPPLPWLKDSVALPASEENETADTAEALPEEAALLPASDGNKPADVAEALPEEDVAQNVETEKAEPPVQDRSQDRADAQEEKFDEVAEVQDADLSTMRGGFMDMNGVLFDFSFLSRISINNEVKNEVSFDTKTQDLIQKVGQITTINQALQPTIIQNQLSDQVIQAATTINLSVTGGIAVALQQNLHQSLNFSNILALR